MLFFCPTWTQQLFILKLDFGQVLGLMMLTIVAQNPEHFSLRAQIMLCLTLTLLKC